jgi:hypothetical protein
MSKEDKMVELLEELVRWTKVTGIPKVKVLLEEILQSPEERIAYEASIESRTQGEIAKLANVSQVTISNYGKKWIKNGIAKSISARGGQRAIKLFSLEDFGIEVPRTTPKRKETSLIEPSPQSHADGQ